MVASRVAAHHFSSPERFITEAARVLKPNGLFLLIDGSVPDDAPEAETWLHTVEKWRDPSHARFLSRTAWEGLVRDAELEILISRLDPMKQPDLEWYFETAGTTAENRVLVIEAVRTAPEPVRRAMGLAEENGKIVWWWPRLTLLTR